MTNPGQSSDQTPPRQGTSTPRNSGRARNRRNAGGAPSVTGPPVPRTEPESSRRNAGGAPSVSGPPVPRTEPESSTPRQLMREIAATVIAGIRQLHAGSRGSGGVSRGVGGDVGGGVGGGGVVVGTGAVPVSAGGGGIGQRKRIRDREGGAGPSRPVKGHPLPPPEAEGQGLVRCPACPRTFASERALCGHLRAHPDRQWPGAFPPPVFSRQEFYEAGVGHLLNPPIGGGDPIAEGGGELVEPGVETAAVVGQGQGSDASGSAERPEISDVERGISAPIGPNEEEGRGDQERAAEGSDSGERGVLDLNKLPPQDEFGNYI